MQKPLFYTALDKRVFICLINSVVFTDFTFTEASTKLTKSLVIYPSSKVSIQAFSKEFANETKSKSPSSSPRFLSAQINPPLLLITRATASSINV